MTGHYITFSEEERELQEIIENYNDINLHLIGDRNGKPYKKSALNLFKFKFKRFVKKYKNIPNYERHIYNLMEKAVKLNNIAIVEYLLKKNISPVIIYSNIYDTMNGTPFPDISCAIDETTNIEMRQLLAGYTLDKLDEYNKICSSIKNSNMTNGRRNGRRNRRRDLKYDNKEQLKIELRQVLELNFDITENFEEENIEEENIELNYDLTEVFSDINFKKEKKAFCSIC